MSTAVSFGSSISIEIILTLFKRGEGKELNMVNER